MMREKGLAPKSVIQKMAAMKFFYVHVLRRCFRWNELPYPKTTIRLPVILSPEEVRRIIDAASDLYQRAILMTLYSTGMRCAELACLAIGDIDSQRMVVRINRGKGGKNRDVPLSPKLLETLREYWRWMKPQTYLFPSRYKSRKGSPITTKGIFDICQSTARKAGIQKTRSGLMEKLDEAVSGRKEIDADVLDELEFALITADIGARTTSEILERIRQQVERHQLADSAQ